MQTFQILPLTRPLEGPVLLREVIRGAFFCWLSWEHAVATSVLLLSTAADSMQDSTNPISLVIEHYLSSERKEGSENSQDFSQLRNSLRRDIWSRNSRQV